MAAAVPPRRKGWQPGMYTFLLLFFSQQHWLPIAGLDSRRFINVLHRSSGVNKVINVKTYTQRRKCHRRSGVRKKWKKCASHLPRNLLPIFFLRSNQQGAAPAFCDVTQPLSAAGLQRTSREERRRGRREAEGGERQNAWTDATTWIIKKHPSHFLIKERTLSVRRLGGETDDRQEGRSKGEKKGNAF